MLGVGAGTLFPNLSGAAVASAPGESFATATGLNSVSRQVGAALGVALVVAIIGTPTPLGAVSAFDHAWTFGAACPRTMERLCPRPRSQTISTSRSANMRFGPACRSKPAGIAAMKWANADLCV